MGFTVVEKYVDVETALSTGLSKLIIIQVYPGRSWKISLFTNVSGLTH